MISKMEPLEQVLDRPFLHYCKRMPWKQVLGRPLELEHYCKMAPLGQVLHRSFRHEKMQSGLMALVLGRPFHLRKIVPVALAGLRCEKPSVPELERPCKTIVRLVEAVACWLLVTRKMNFEEPTTSAVLVTLERGLTCKFVVAVLVAEPNDVAHQKYFRKNSEPA